MENKLRLKLSRIFQTSLNSCRTKNTSDVSVQPFFFPENRHHRQLIDLFSPKPQPFPSLCKPKSSDTPKIYEKRPKVSDRNTLLVPPGNNGEKCPPASPVTPLNTNTIFHERRPKKTRSRRAHYRKTNRKSETNEFFASLTANYYGTWYSSDEDDDDDDDETTLFSSKSLSSDSSESFRKHKARLADRKAKKDSQKRAAAAAAAGVVPILEGKNGKAKEGFAVVKKSSDPHNDFRTSMVEMIVEKQIFGAQELENLLQCFLSLNSDHHHRIIVEVFSEILETLFSDGY